MPSSPTSASRQVRTPLWHPFADMSSVAASAELTIERGEGVWVQDDEGSRYLDASGALWYCNVGHGRERLADAAREQMLQLAGYQIFDDISNPPARELADRLCELAGRLRIRSGQRRVPDQRRIRRGRYGRQDQPPLLASARPAGAHLDHLALGRLPRHARLRNQPGRNRGQRRRLGPARARRGPGRSRRRRGAGTCPRGEPGPRGRLHRRAGPGRRRRVPAGGGLLAGGPGSLPASTTSS